MMILTVIVFIFILGLLVFVHEFGHFLLAKRAGILVEEFGFGFPPRIFGIKKGETIYSLNLFPLGGFVKIYGEDGSPESEKDPRSFSNRPVWTRVKIIVAGVLMNFLLAYVLLSGGLVFGKIPTVEVSPAGGKLLKSEITIAYIAPNSPAEDVLKINDVILSVDNEEIKSIKQLQELTRQRAGQKILLKIKRGKEILDIEIIPRPKPPKNEGPLGIALNQVDYIAFSWWKAPIVALKLCGSTVLIIFFSLWNLIKNIFIHASIPSGVTGPVGIFVLTRQAVGIGFDRVLFLIIMLSLTLAVINIFPFPALDGGKLLFLIIEKIRGKKVAANVENIIHWIGFILLILFILAITYKDVVRVVLGKGLY